MVFRKRISLLVIVCYTLSLFGQTLLQDAGKNMHIVNILDNIISADKGSFAHVQTGDIYHIMNSDSLVIGKAKVVIVKDSLSALEIIDLDTDTRLQKGFGLVMASPADSAHIGLLIEAKKKDFNKEQLTKPTNYYSEGLNFGEENYSGGGALASGLIAGFGLGLIGWGIGYLIVANKSVDFPQEYTETLDEDAQSKFSKGYTEKVISKRTTSFHIGAAIGTLGAVILITSTSKK